jgi:transcriptional regulator with XRE-family HTH domain
MRELIGKTQADLAEEAKTSQGEISEAERRKDHLVSTLRRYVKALGGELEVIARFGDRSVKLHGV